MSFAKGIAAFFIVGLLAAIGYFVYLNYRFTYTVLRTPQSQYYTPGSIKIYPKMHLHQLANELQQKNLWSKPYSFVLLARLHGFAGTLRYGEYRLTSRMTARDLLTNIKHGRGVMVHRIRIREGSTFSKTLDALRLNENLQAFPRTPPISELLLKNKQLRALSTRSMEGLIYPDTYTFSWGTSDLGVLRYASRKMISVLNAQWKKRAKKLPIKNRYQALIVASLIQTEASSIDERPKVAAVIYNRMRKHMRLQIDPTVMYGLGLPYGSILTKRQLRKKTRYNTYKIKGLPPTPIALPTLTSITAALHPAKFKALFYVSNGHGGHNFTNNYAAHKKAVKKYRTLVAGRRWKREKEAVKALVEELL